MEANLSKFEGTWEEIASHESELRGHRLRLTVLEALPADHTASSETQLEQGSYERIEQGLREHPVASTETRDLWDVIAEERAEWRRIAAEKDS